MRDKNLLRNYKGFLKQAIGSIMNDVKNAVSGCLLPSELEDDAVNIDIRDMTALENEEETAKRQQKWQRLKILTPKQMITRMDILLAQLKAGNNSEKLKNEIRQIVYSLYR